MKGFSVDSLKIRNRRDQGQWLRGPFDAENEGKSEEKMRSKPDECMRMQSVLAIVGKSD